MCYKGYMSCVIKVICDVVKELEKALLTVRRVQ